MMMMTMVKKEEKEDVSASDTIKVEVEQEFLNQDSITVPVGDVKPVFAPYPKQVFLFPSTVDKDEEEDDDTLIKKPLKKEAKRLQQKRQQEEEDEEEELDGFEIQRQLFASFEGKGEKKQRRKYGNARLYYEEDVQEDKELRRVAPAKSELRVSKAALRDDLGRHYFLPDAKKHSYAKDIILTAIDEYGDDPRYGFYWVTLAPHEHEYPNIDDVLRVRQHGKQKKKDWFTAHVVKIQGDKDRRQGKRSTSWVVLKL